MIAKRIVPALVSLVCLFSSTSSVESNCVSRLLLLLPIRIQIYSLGFLMSLQNQDSHRFVNLPRYGTLMGSISKTTWTNRPIYQFLGVRYGESPSGNRRFKVYKKQFSNCHKSI